MAELSSADAEHRASFLRQMRRAPGTVAIVATAADGDRAGLAVTAWNSLSADPPMLLACVNRKAGAHPLALRAGAFSVNLLASTQSETVAIFSAQRALDGAARFLDGEWTEGPMGQPMLRQAIAAFECVLEGAHDHGSHTILVGRVGEIISRDEDDALLYLDGRFASAVRAP